jgi:hypothetical protein
VVGVFEMLSIRRIASARSLGARLRLIRASRASALS